MSTTSNTATMQEDTSKKEMKKFERWRKSLQYLTGLGMDETERKAFRDKLDVDMEDYQCQQCERWKTNLIKNSR
jgi:inner membrane protease ATP23